MKMSCANHIDRREEYEENGQRREHERAMSKLP
jgi:hypothetical protein